MSKSRCTKLYFVLGAAPSRESSRWRSSPRYWSRVPHCQATTSLRRRPLYYTLRGKHPVPIDDLDEVERLLTGIARRRVG